MGSATNLSGGPRSMTSRRESEKSKETRASKGRARDSTAYTSSQSTVPSKPWYTPKNATCSSSGSTLWWVTYSIS